MKKLLEGIENYRGMILEAERYIAIPDKRFSFNRKIGTGSTDMGDLSGIMPVVHPYIPSAVGTSHGDDYVIDDPYTATVLSAKWQLAMIILLLENGASRAKKIISEYEPDFASKEEYFAFVEKIRSFGDRIKYNGDDTATVIL